MGRVVLGMIGLGTVGTGVVKLLAQQKHLVLKKVAVANATKPRSIDLPCAITTNISEVISDPEIEILVEVMGGEHPCLEYIEQAIDHHKHIVTANKELLAKHGPSLFNRARQNGVAIFFEASVAGGIPLISVMEKGLEANQISSIAGILNGTTNYILSHMQDGSYESALSQAQALGFAEADPTNDVEGYDVAYKLSILSALAYGSFVNPQDIYKEGITKICMADIAFAEEFGYKIKLIGSTSRINSSSGSPPKLDVRVHPMLVGINHPLASVSGANNGILVDGDAVGEIILVGSGAGQMPTASAVVGDIINLASALQLPDFSTYFQPSITSTWANLSHQGYFAYYLRLQVDDAAGVIGRIGTIFGNQQISIQSIVHRENAGSSTTIVILTHEALETTMNQILLDLQSCEFIQELAACIRIFNPTVSYA